MYNMGREWLQKMGIKMIGPLPWLLARWSYSLKMIAISVSFGELEVLSRANFPTLEN